MRGRRWAVTTMLFRCSHLFAVRTRCDAQPQPTWASSASLALPTAASPDPGLGQVDVSQARPGVCEHWSTPTPKQSGVGRGKRGENEAMQTSRTHKSAPARVSSTNLSSLLTLCLFFLRSHSWKQTRLTVSQAQKRGLRPGVWCMLVLVARRLGGLRGGCRDVESGRRFDGASAGTLEEQSQRESARRCVVDWKSRRGRDVAKW